MFKACKEATNILFSSYEETALISGISDIIVVKWSENKYKSSPFLVCLGSLTHRIKQEQIEIFINDKKIQDVRFTANKYGYLEPFHPSSKIISKLQLQHGRNIIAFKTSRVNLVADIFLYNLNDKIIISDMDGTMTKTDLMGLYSNYRQIHYLHDGYQSFIKELSNQGYRIVWITMRSIALYGFSKKYIEKYVGCQGALLPEPEEFFPSVKKEIMKNTGNIKTNMIRKIRELFPPQINPFAGGLGNRENDAIAYLACGIPDDKIYIVSQSSQIMTLKKKVLKSYVQLKQQILCHFPPIAEVVQEIKEDLKEKFRTTQISEDKQIQNANLSKRMRDFFQQLQQQNRNSKQQYQQKQNQDKGG